MLGWGWVIRREEEVGNHKRRYTLWGTERDTEVQCRNVISFNSHKIVRSQSHASRAPYLHGVVNLAHQPKGLNLNFWLLLKNKRPGKDRLALSLRAP